MCGGKLSLVVQSDEAKFFFNILDSLHLGAGGEGAARLKQKLLAVLSDEAASNFHLLNGVGNGETFEDGDGVGNTITGINNETSRSSVGIQGHDGLDGNVQVTNLKSFEHLLGHQFSVLFGVSWSLSDQDTLDFTGSDSELVVESVVPNFFHIIPIFDDTTGDGVLQVENTSFFSCLITDVMAFL